MNTALLSLLQLSDPALPIGGYAHSGGLETYVQEDLVRDPATAKAFVSEMLRTSLFYTDAALVALAHDATANPGTAGHSEVASNPGTAGHCEGASNPGTARPDAAAGHATLHELDALCEAAKIPREIREASRKLGNRLLKIFGQTAAGAGPKTGIATSPAETPQITHYPIVFGYCAASMHIGLQETLTGFYYNAAAGIVTNCVKLIPIGQLEGQQIMLSLQPLIHELVEKGKDPDKDLIGRCCTALDIRCMQHEQLYSRLYMS